MCGIAGLVGRAPHDGVIEQMLARLARRGPDGEGQWRGGLGGWHVRLGHRRLAIIDVDGGRQPMESEDGSVVVSFNGEIYNFMELRRELEALGRRFRTRSDTEVIVHAVSAWGPRAVERLNGMFAFAAWNGATGELLLARDRAGVKPLYYAALPDGGLAFGSELTAVLEHPAIERGLDRDGLLSYFFSDYAHPPHTLVEGVKKLAPGELVTWKDGVLAEPSRYWTLRLDTGAVAVSDPETLARELWRRLGDAVERQLVSDVPVGVFLSGGIDSSAITILASERYPGRLKTFSIGFEDAAFDESVFAREVAERCGTEHVEERIGERDMLAVIDEVLERLDEPVADHSIVPTYVLSRLAAKHVKVALGGDGGDELFGGYPTYRAHSIARAFAMAPARLRNELMPRLVGKLPTQRGYQRLDWKLKRFFGRWDDATLVRHLRWMSNVDLPELGRALPACTGRPAALGASVPQSPDELGRLLALDFVTYMPGSVLAKVDRATMAHGLESRPPMLDNEVIDWAFSLPSSVKMRGGRAKALLKDAVRPHLPERVVGRRKQGFSVPLAAWLSGPLAPRIDRVFEDSPLWHARALDREVFRRYWGQHLARRGDHAKTLWALLVLDTWAKKERIDVR